MAKCVVYSLKRCYVKSWPTNIWAWLPWLENVGMPPNPNIPKSWDWIRLLLQTTDAHCLSCADHTVARPSPLTRDKAVFRAPMASSAAGTRCIPCLALHLARGVAQETTRQVSSALTQARSVNYAHLCSCLHQGVTRIERQERHKETKAWRFFLQT